MNHTIVLSSASFFQTWLSQGKARVITFNVEPQDELVKIYLSRDNDLCVLSWYCTPSVVCCILCGFFPNTMAWLINIDHFRSLNLARNSSFLLWTQREALKDPDSSSAMSLCLFFSPTLLPGNYYFFSSCMSCSCLELFCLSPWKRNPVCDSLLDTICNVASIRAPCGSQSPWLKLRQYSFTLPTYSLITFVWQRVCQQWRLMNTGWQAVFVCWVDLKLLLWYKSEQTYNEDSNLYINDYWCIEN